jgi:dipeptidyl aminopeptidase/acylaminoacyl peptidase
MKKQLFFLFLTTMPFFLVAQTMTAEKLWQLNRISGVGLSTDGKAVIYSSRTYDIDRNSSSAKTYQIPLKGGVASEINDLASIYNDPKIDPSGRFKIMTESVKVKPVTGKDHYPKLDKSDVYIYENLNYRHWDSWEDGSYNHIFLKDLLSDSAKAIDLMESEPYHCPLMPFGGSEDYVWNTEGTQVVYVTLKQVGNDYATSTNTDLYAYDLETKNTVNLTEENKGYDTQPSFSNEGILAWLQMDEPGYESDKNDIVMRKGDEQTNLTEHWDGTVSAFRWSNDGKKIFFIAPISGTIQLFELTMPKEGLADIRQITNGQWDVTSMVGQSGNTMAVTRTDMNHAAEIYSVNLKNGDMVQLTHANDTVYTNLKMGKVEKRMVPTTDGKELLSWVIYPPDFDPSKKYPTLLYCQGGPQSALTQFYSYRWNFQLMAAQGYIVVAPNRRGMPGHGVAWNEQISGDWGGQNIKDYLVAIDAVAQEPFVDKNRLGCVGASYGGYSVFYLAGVHDHRFKSFVAHDGIFNTVSMYGTTEELFFVNKDLGGPYWQQPTPKAYTHFNPINQVNQWDTPILIIQGGKDYRVPIGQGLEAFQAAQLKGLKSKLLYFPDENHWILSAQNAIIWQNEFFKWLNETMD